MSAREQNSADDGRVANTAMQGMQDLILNAISVESKALGVEVKQMQQDIRLILSKLPGDSSEKDLPKTCSVPGRFASVRLSGAAESSTTVRSAKKDASKGSGAAERSTSTSSRRVSRGVSSASEVPSTRRSREATLSRVASPPRSSRESTPKITEGQSEAEEEDMNDIRRCISGEFHVEARPSTTCFGKPSVATRTSRRYQATRCPVPKASLDVPREAQRGVSLSSIVPAEARDSKDSDGVSLPKTPSGKRQSRDRVGTVPGKSARANQAPDFGGLGIFPSEVSTATCSEAAKTNGTGSKSFHIASESGRAQSGDRVGTVPGKPAKANRAPGCSSLGTSCRELAAAARSEAAKTKGADFESFHAIGEGMEEYQGEPSQEESGVRATGALPDDGVAFRAGGLVGRCGGSIEAGMARLCGVLPWSMTRKWSTWLYQQLLAVVATTAAIGLVGVLAAEIPDGEANLATILEALLAVGSSLGLWSCQVHRSSKRLVHAQEVITGWMSSNDIQPETGRAHVALSMLMWTAAVGVHVGADAFDDVKVSTSQKVGFAVVSFLHTALMSMIVYQCNRIRVILGAFSDSVTDGKDFSKAVYEWHIVQACCRGVSRAVEACFVVMVTFASIGVLVVVLRMSSEDVSLRMVPALLLTLASFRVLFYAAAVTHTCTQVPVLVNSVGMGRTLDPTRMYAVQYMRYCQSGFYIFGTRITPSGVMKVAYIGCAVAFAVFTQHNPDSPIEL